MNGGYIPVIPETITVHLGTPSQAAPNVTVPFVDYVKRQYDWKSIDDPD